MISTIFIDLDDVLNAFTMSALKYVGCPVGVYDYHKYDPNFGFDIVSAANFLHPLLSFTIKEFWRRLDPLFWSTIPLSQEAGELIDACKSLVGSRNVCILTAPTHQSYVAKAKMEWMEANLPPWIQRQFLIGPHKEFCAREDALLIDDSDKNISRFRHAGGQTILVPRPWNSNWDSLLSSSQTDQYLKVRFNRLFVEQCGPNYRRSA